MKLYCFILYHFILYYVIHLCKAEVDVAMAMALKFGLMGALTLSSGWVLYQLVKCQWGFTQCYRGKLQYFYNKCQQDAKLAFPVLEELFS